MEIGGIIAGELKENGDWVLLTPSNSASVICRCLDNDMGSLENPQMSRIWEETEQMEKEKGDYGCKFGNSSSKSQEIAHKCNDLVSNTEDDVKSSEDSARKNGFLVSAIHGSSFETLGLHGISDNNSPHQETIEVEVPFKRKNGSQLDNQTHCESGLDSTKASSMRKNRNSKSRSNKGITLNKKPRKRLKMKKHRPKIFDESKPMKTSTPKPRLPKRAKYVKKDKLKTPVATLKDADREAVSDHNINYCEQKLDSNMGICITNLISKDCEGMENKPDEEPKVDPDGRFSSLQVYHRKLRPNECLKNSRKLGPNCPSICKKPRSRRQRATMFDKFVTISTIPPTRKKRRAAVVARKLALLVAGDLSSSFESSELHRIPEGKTDGNSDDRPHQETIEIDVPFTWEKASELHNHHLHCEFEMNAMIASCMPKNQTPKKRSNNSIDLNKKPWKRLRMERHRPKVFDKSKPIKPSTPKPRTPRRAKYVKKYRRNTQVDPLKDDDSEEVSDYNRNFCRHKLDFIMDNCIEDHDLKVCDELEDKPDEEPRLDAGRRFSSLKVYTRVLKPNECLKNSRKIGPNCPHIFKKTRSRRQRATMFDKFIMFLLTQEQKKAEMYGPLALYPMVKDRKTRSQTLSKRQKSLRACVSMEEKTTKANEHPALEKVTFNINRTVNSKKKRSKRSTRRRDLSFFINDLSKIQVSKTFLPKAQDSYGKKFAYGVEVLQDNVVFCNGSIPNCPTEFGDCVRRVGTNRPKYNLGSETLNYQVVNGQTAVANDLQEIGSFTDTYLSYDKYQCRCDMNDFPACFQQKEDTMLECTEHSLESDIATLFLGVRDFLVSKEALVDYATQRMERLHIDDRCKQLTVTDQNAHGALVPSTGKFDPSKKRKKLPKVDLDDETLRVWNLLMENNGSEHTESEDDDKEKYWKEQREIFSGRAESFIACMHLFQGDRRFSPWKGSVVDSVVGVFLTQNVSDHLSSSSFMELASRYPPPSVSENNGCEGRTEHVIREIRQKKMAETSSDECRELSITGKVPSSSPSHDVEVNPENGNKSSSLIESTSETKKGKANNKHENTINWDDLRKTYSHGTPRKRLAHTLDSVNWESVRKASVRELAKVIETRGMYNALAGRIKDFLDRVVRDHGSIDLEWLRDVPPDKVKEYLLSIPGLGLKSVECVRLLTLHHHAFPVDTNVGRILVRLGWVPLQTLPGDLQIHLLEQYPLLDNIQKYIWPRVCHLPQLTLYELHYQMITFGKVFCTKRSPKCNACPMRAECRHYASALASRRIAVEGPQTKNTANESSAASDQDSVVHTIPPMISHCDNNFFEDGNNYYNCEPIVEIPPSPEPYIEEVQDIEDFDFNSECDDEIPTIKLNTEEFTNNVSSFVDGYDGVSQALVTVRPEIASLPMLKLKKVNRLSTLHLVYELPDSHPLLAGFDRREPDDPCPYLLRIWMPKETTNSSQESRKTCSCKESTTCEMGTCSPEIVQFQNNQIIQGTILIPCRTANRGSFPLNGTYFQVNEVFADAESSQSPIAVPRAWIWYLRRRALYCGTSATSISRGMSLEEIEHCFRRGFICIRGMDRRTRAARPLVSSFHWWKTKQADEE